MSESTKPKSTDRLTRVLRWVLVAVATAAILAAAWLAYAYAVTPEPIRHPTHAHYHFRLQIINDGTPVNLGDAKYQTEFNKDICTAALTKEPIHFHDQLNQFVHIHWGHLTGGIVLKNYGWNLIGGTTRTLGYRFDQFPRIIRVPVHGRDLPRPPAGTRYYIYSGDENGYRARDWKEFIKTDVRDFLANQPKTTSWLDHLIPSASAHQEDEAELAKLNNVLDSVVIFAQNAPPTDQQIKDRFAHLVPLPESTCGG